jgi:glucose-6-phosphate-specific signal transduction histidine kinase
MVSSEESTRRPIQRELYQDVYSNFARTPLRKESGYVQRQRISGGVIETENRDSWV